MKQYGMKLLFGEIPSNAKFIPPVGCTWWRIRNRAGHFAMVRMKIGDHFEEHYLECNDSGELRPALLNAQNIRSAAG